MQKCDSSQYTKISVLGLGCSMAICWGLGVLLLSYLSLWYGVATPIVNLLASGYIGYKATYIGGLIGLAWALVDGFVFGALIAFVYNKCLKCCCKE